MERPEQYICEKVRSRPVLPGSVEATGAYTDCKALRSSTNFPVIKMFSKWQVSEVYLTTLKDEKKSKRDLAKN
jgi:hypothetical protein